MYVCTMYTVHICTVYKYVYWNTHKYKHKTSDICYDITLYAHTPPSYTLPQRHVQTHMSTYASTHLQYTYNRSYTRTLYDVRQCTSYDTIIHITITSRTQIHIQACEYIGVIKVLNRIVRVEYSLMGDLKFPFTETQATILQKRFSKDIYIFISILL